MAYFILPLLTLLFFFMSFLTSLRFLLTREGSIWILPSFFSLIMSYVSLDELISSMNTSKFDLTLRVLLNLLCAAIWYLVIISMHSALKKRESERKKRDSRINKAEAKYIEKIERKRLKREKKEKEDDNVRYNTVPQLYSSSEREKMEKDFPRLLIRKHEQVQ